MKNTRMKGSRFNAVIITLLMLSLVFTLLPVTAFAADEHIDIASAIILPNIAGKKVSEVTAASGDSTKYDVNILSWKETPTYTLLGADDILQAKQYFIVLEFSAKSGYTFSGASTKYYINEKECSASSAQAKTYITLTTPDGAQQPDIISQPTPYTTYLKGDTADPITVEAVVVDGGTLSYKWYKSISSTMSPAEECGTNSNTYTPDTSAIGQIYYWCEVTNTKGSASAMQSSDMARITVVGAKAPTITAQPSGANYTLGETAAPMTIAANVTDGGTLSYQWYKNTTGSTSGAEACGTGESYIPDVSAVGTTYYYCKVTNTRGDNTKSTNSAIVSISVRTIFAPEITEQPLSADYTTGETAAALKLTANSEDGGTLSYQWYRNTVYSNEGGTACGTDSNTYTPDITAVGTAYYYCVVTNSKGTASASAKSNTAIITVNESGGTLLPVAAAKAIILPDIAGKKISEVRAVSGDNTKYDVDIVSWKLIAGGQALSADTVLQSRQYLIVIKYKAKAGYTFEGAGTKYYINEKESSESSAQAWNYITVTTPGGAQKPDIVSQSSHTSYMRGEAADPLTVEAVVVDGGTLSYKWYKSIHYSMDDAEECGTNSNTYTPDTSAGGQIYYMCEVTNTKNSATATESSNAISITVYAAELPAITAQPSAADYTLGETAAAMTIGANVTDGGTLSYKWYKNTISSTSGAESCGTGDSYTPDITAVGTTYYYCAVTNTRGTDSISKNSNIVAVRVSSAEAPVITVQPADADYNVRDTATPLTVTASVTDGGTLSYIWYKNTVKSTDGASQCANGSAAYTPDTETVGTSYYYCVVINTKSTDTASTRSDIAAISVTDAAEHKFDQYAQNNAETHKVSCSECGITKTEAHLKKWVYDEKANIVDGTSGTKHFICPLCNYVSAPEPYTISAEDNSGVVKLYANIEAGEDTPWKTISARADNTKRIPADSPSNDGHILKGWAFSPDAADAVWTANEEIMVPYGETKLYAVWEESAVTLSGNIKSYNPRNAVAITLYAAGDHTAALKTTSIAASSGSGQVTQSFSIADVAAGTYDLVITKPGHLVYTISNVEVGISDIDLTAAAGKEYQTITLLAGDVNGDEKISSDDLNMVWKPSNYLKTPGSAGVENITDVNGDGKINSDDLNIIWKPEHYLKTVSDCIYSY